MMLKDEEVMPLCRMWARRFLRQGLRSGGSQQDVYNELVNVGYATAKPLGSAKNASKWIMWMLARYVDAHPQTKFARIDRRVWMRSTAPSPLEVAQMKEERHRLIKAVARLSDEERTIIYWYYRDEKTLDEIGRSVDLSRTSVLNQIRCTLNKLRVMMRGGADHDR